MARSRSPKLRGLVGMLALISTIVVAVAVGLSPGRALGAVAVPDPSVVPTAERAVPAAATTAIPQNPAAAVPAQAAAVAPSSAAAAIPSGRGTSGAGARQPDPSPATAAQAVAPEAQKVIAQAEAAPGTTSTAQKVPKPDKPSSASASARRQGWTSRSARTHRRHHAAARRIAPVVLVSTMPATVVTPPAFSRPAPTAVHILAEVHERVSADRRSRSPKLATVDTSSPVGGLLPASGSPSPAGAAAGGVGTGVGSPAATLLTLVALCLLGALLPGLLGLDIGPWRSARYAMRLERPG
ncbi:MAG: hypothetical protein ACXVUE_07535 [Solirubrobacteraceae bacterium]